MAAPAEVTKVKNRNAWEFYYLILLPGIVDGTINSTKDAIPFIIKYRKEIHGKNRDFNINKIWLHLVNGEGRRRDHAEAVGINTSNITLDFEQTHLEHFILAMSIIEELEEAEEDAVIF